MSRAVAASEGAELLPVEDMSLLRMLPDRDRVDSLSCPSSGTPELATALVITTFGGGAGIAEEGAVVRLELGVEALPGPPPARKT